jgi:mxaJ protein
MCSRFLSAMALVATLTGCGREQRVLRVCADPNNLPFSNQREEGFENRIAEVMADALGARVEYTWFPQRRGFVRNTLGAGLCDAIMGVPARYDPVETTRSYYRSTYVFVTREDRKLALSSFDDPALRTLTIGIHITGDDYSNPPPAHALSRRHMVNNIAGYSIYGDYSQPNPPARLIEAVSNGDVDVAVVWGPLGGFFAGRQPAPLAVSPVAVDQDDGMPFAFEIAMGVRKGDHARRDELQRALDLRRADVARILADYRVPLKEAP